MLSFRVNLVVLAALLMSACQPKIVTLAPPPTPETWQVEITPALRWLGPIFQRCAAGLPGPNLVLNERPAAQLGGSLADFSFQWGDRAAAMVFAAVIGEDSLVVVVNPANPVGSLTSNEIRSLFNGKTNRWSLRNKEACASCAPDFEGAVLAYVYAAGEDVRAAADWIPAGPAAVLAPGPAEVRDAVAQERFSVGYLPARWLDASVKVVTVEPGEPGLLVRPVLAFSPREPQSTQRAWLACIQAALK